MRSLSYLPADADPKSMARARTSFMVQLRGIACARLQGQPGSGRSGCGSGRRSRGAAGRRGEARGGCGGRGRPRARTCGGKCTVRVVCSALRLCSDYKLAIRLNSEVLH